MILILLGVKLNLCVRLTSHNTGVDHGVLCQMCKKSGVESHNTWGYGGGGWIYQ